VSSPEAAELVKILENTFRSVNIGLVNEMAIVCDKLGVDVWEVIEAAATKPFGFMKFTPGPGVGGHCIPLDPHYLAWKMRTLNYKTRFIELAAPARCCSWASRTKRTSTISARVRRWM
jgi:UDP-N-acetyl-D-glucosamine dehydrogenase